MLILDKVSLGTSNLGISRGAITVAEEKQRGELF